MHPLKKTGVVLAALLFLTASISPAAAPAENIGKTIDSYISSFPAHERFNGVILVSDGERILFQKGYGPADIASGAPNTIDTGFQIGSISKAFTAMIALKLAEQGVIDLDKAVSDFLPFYPAEAGFRPSWKQRAGVGFSDTVKESIPGRKIPRSFKDPILPRRLKRPIVSVSHRKA